MKKSLTNDTIKREIFANLTKDPRYIALANYVADAIKRGQEPTVIESFNTYYQRVGRSPEDYLPTEVAQHLRTALCTKNAIMEARGLLSPEADRPHEKPQAVFVVLSDKKEVGRFSVEAPTESTPLYYGFRDKNYVCLFFKTLGYQVEEGYANNRFGIKISLKD